MHLESNILIFRKPEEVWAFLGSVSNIEKWDRGVARTETTRHDSASPVGIEFDTFAEQNGSDWGRMSYRIIGAGSDYCTVQLTSSTGNARYFKNAHWTFRTRPDPQGTLLTCTAQFALRLRYCFLAPCFSQRKMRSASIFNTSSRQSRQAESVIIRSASVNRR